MHSSLCKPLGDCIQAFVRVWFSIENGRGVFTADTAVFSTTVDVSTTRIFRQEYMAWRIERQRSPILRPTRNLATF